MLIRRLDEHHSVCISRSFPKIVHSTTSLRHRVMLGVGGNVGDVRRRLEHLWVYLGRFKTIKRMQSGVILRNPPFGYLDQADFDNTVIELSTSLAPRALLRVLWRIENRFKRRRSFPNAPRTLDLDILFFDNQTFRYPELIIPHPKWRERSSVVVPLKSLGRKRGRKSYENLDI